MKRITSKVSFVTLLTVALAGLWVLPLFASEPYLVKDINTSPAGSFSIPTKLVEVNGILYFTAFKNQHGRELWKSDGTEAGTVMVKDINPGGGWSSNGLEDSINVNGTLFFAADDGVHGQELWKSDGTEAGTVLVKDIFPGGDWSFPGDFINVNGILFFVDPDNCSNYRSQGEARYVHISEVDDSPLSTCHHGLCGGEPAVESAVECDSVIVLARGHQ